MVEYILVKLEFCFPFDYHHFEQRKKVNSQLDHKVSLQFVAGVIRPVREILVDLRAGSAPSDHAREPILVAEHNVGEDGHNEVKDAIVRELKHRM